MNSQGNIRELEFPSGEHEVMNCRQWLRNYREVDSYYLETSTKFEDDRWKDCEEILF